MVPIRAVKAGDIVLVKPGDRVPVDGIVTEGNSAVDEAMLSGESEPVSKGIDDRCRPGPSMVMATLQIRVQGMLKDTALGRIIRLVEEAQASKAPIQCVADRIVPWFVAITLALALATFLWWRQTDFELALLAATAVLIITCPCAFGLATPMSIAVASGFGANHGILVKNGAVLETLSGIEHVVFDKTGTLTEGRISVSSLCTADERWTPGSGEEMPPLTPDMAWMLARLAAVERYSEHPVAGAVLGFARTMGVDIGQYEAANFQNRPGLG